MKDAASSLDIAIIGETHRNPAKTILVTGANRGIGLGASLGLARRGHRVLMACRDRAAAESACARILADSRVLAEGGAVDLAPTLDLGSLESLRSFAADLAAMGLRLDALIHNAGVLCSSREETIDGFERSFGVNFLGPFLLTRLLLPLVAQGGRIVNVTSIAGLFGRLDAEDLGFHRGYSPLRAYARSKFAILQMSVELAVRLRGRAAVNAVHPGIVNTRILTLHRWFDPLADAFFRPLVRGLDSGAAPLVELAVSSRYEGCTGAYYSRFKQHRPRGRFADPQSRRELWTLASRMVGEPEDISVKFFSSSDRKSMLIC